MDRLLLGGAGRLGGSVLLFGGVCRAGRAEAETDGGHRTESASAKPAAVNKPEKQNGRSAVTLQGTEKKITVWVNVCVKPVSV